MKYARQQLLAKIHGPVRSVQAQAGKMGYILLWLIGVPIPVLLLIYLLRGCT